jgi:hypothetical protein
MNILFVEMEQHNLQFMKKLAEDGHSVYTNQSLSKNYLKSLGINTVGDDLPHEVWAVGHSWSHLIDMDTYEEVGNGLPKWMEEKFEKTLEKYKIDLVVNTYPPFNEIMHLKDWGVDFVSASPDAIKLEQEKIFANTFAKHCGMKTPQILQTGNSHKDIDLDPLPNSFVIKPSNKWTSATIVKDKGLLEAFPTGKYLFGGDHHSAIYNYYIEELIKGQETNISYIMSNGKWSFTFSESCDESKAKQIFNVNPVVWYADTTINQLTPEVDKMVRDNVVEYLNQAAKLGGTYEGSITQMLGEDGELYFLENNCRPYVNNTFPIPYTGNEYLDAFRNNPKKIGDWFEGRKFPKVVIQNKNIGNQDQECEYPFHLHDKYKIAEPTPIEIIDGKYIATKGGVVIIFEDEINMDFINEVEKDSDLRAYWGN